MAVHEYSASSSSLTPTIVSTLELFPYVLLDNGSPSVRDHTNVALMSRPTVFPHDKLAFVFCRTNIDSEAVLITGPAGKKENNSVICHKRSDINELLSYHEHFRARYSFPEY